MWGEIVLAGLIAIAAGATAWADGAKTVADVPRFKLFASSHSTAAAEVLAFHGVKKGLPQVVLIGGLEGRIYRCDCGKGIDLWDIAAGTRLWAAAEGLKVTTSAGAVGPSQAGAPVPHSDGESLDFADYRQAIDARQPVVLTYSLDAASDKGMEASFRSQERVSVVGVGYQETDSVPCVIALAPEGVEGADARTGGSGKQENERDRFRRLMAMPGVKKGDREGLVLIPWEPTTGNLIATFITVEKP